MLISIITVSFNSSKTIIDTIRSVNLQTYPKIEHIFIDGLSSDKTVEIIRRNSKRKNLVISEKDKGLYDAINKGIKNANGDIIGILHSDDFFHFPETISLIARKIQNENLDGVYGDLKYVSEKNTNKTIRYWKSCKFNSKLLKKGWMPAHPTFFLKKEVYKKHGLYNLNYTISADYDFILRIFKDKNLKFGYLNKVVINMRVGGVSNKSLKNIIIKIREDYRAIQNNKIGGLATVVLKNTSKIIQFLR